MQFSGDLVIATPDIYQVALGPEAEFILLATDGLWDYIKRCSLLVSSMILGNPFILVV